MVAARARLASTLLALCWAASALSGCLLSQEDRVLNIPAQRNRPPRIMEELLDPKARVMRIPDCRDLAFTFNAEDPDVDDLLTVRWYVDYDRTQLFIQDNEQTLQRSGKPQRDDPGSLTINLNSPALVLPASQLQTPGPHVVEAVLFDFRLARDRTPLPIPGADGEILNPSYAVSYAWVVEMETSCPR